VRLRTKNERTDAMTEHRFGTQEEWQAERDELLKAEKELTRRGDELTKKRLELPWVPVEKDYSFETDDGTTSLADLFDGRSQLLIYHFMFGPPYEAGCTVCSSIADNLNANAPHLNAGGVTVLLASRAPVDRLEAYKERMGWDNLDWVSTVGDDFNRDLGFLNTEEELKPFLEGEIPPSVELMAKLSGTDVKGYVTEGPGMSVYALSDATVYRTYVTTARGLEGPAMGYYGLLDRTPKGRQELADRPIWLRRHDEYEAN
jgi:predicted dithiol-disulfide oxidoreductase (DUF899 family)